MKNLSKKARIAAISSIAVAVIAVIAFAAALAMRTDVTKAQNAALAAAGGGEIISQEVENEWLWSEYSFDIMNGDTWYEVEVNTFGKVTGLESRLGSYGNQNHLG